MEPTVLCEIMGRHGSDKGHVNISTSWHNYTIYYYSIFNNIRYDQLRIFELGIGTNNINLKSNMGINGKPGASLFGWREFFPNSLVFGADIDTDILFESERIKTFYCDQTNPSSIKKMWGDSNLQLDFDIIIEDGLHEFEASVCFFENSIHKLKKGGYFIIEDIKNTCKNLFESKIKEFELLHTDCTFNILTIPSSQNGFDNCLVVVHRQ